jgi:phage repressor protein C with HTH and peptisase S24 domain
MMTQRFKQIREEHKFTQQAFAKLLGVPTSTADIERGKTKIPGYVVAQLMKLFQVNPLWLFGESEQKYLSPQEPQVAIMPKVITVSETQAENIVLVSQKAAAGYPHNIHDTGWYQQLPAFAIPLPQFRNATYRGFQVEGDSMLPNIHPNEWVIGKAVSSVAEISENRVCVIVLQDSVLVKKIKKLPGQRLQLISYNEEYTTIEVGLNQVQELWQVTSKISFGLEEDSNSYLLKELQASMQELKSQLKSFAKVN